MQHDCCYCVCLALDLLGGPPLVCCWLLLQCLPGSGSPHWTSPGVWLAATTVSAWLWISLVDLPWCGAGCYYSVCLALDLLSEPPLMCGWLLLQCLPGSGSPRWISPAWCVADCYYSVCLPLDLLSGTPLVCGWLLLQCLPGSGSPR